MEQKLVDILSSLNTKAIKACGLLAIWDRVVDERVRKHTEPIKITNRKLYVTTSSSAWAQELTFLKTEIIEKFNSTAGEEAISDIRFSAS